MIFIDKTKIPVPKVLTDPKGKGVKEITEAIAHFTSSQKNKTFHFKAYGDKTVKKALTKLFNGKCAYCENKIVAITTGDIEHFRPKLQVKLPDNKFQKPGYFWLAADWDNLLLACNNCNRTTTQELIDGGELTMGKLDQFPLTSEKKRCREFEADGAKYKKKIKADEDARLLINPCIDDPELHLEYQDNGVPKPKLLAATGKPSRKAEKSIEVFGLFRKPLVEERQELIKDILLKIVQVKAIFEAIVVAKPLNNAVLNKIHDDALKREIKSLSDLTLPDKRFSAVAKQLIIPFLKENQLM
jgi:hypothetical protein